MNVFVVIRESGEYSDYQWMVVYTSLDKARAEDECADRNKKAIKEREIWKEYETKAQSIFNEMYPQAGGYSFRVSVSEREKWVERRDAELGPQPYTEDCYDGEYSLLEIPLDTVGKWGKFA